MPVETNDMSNEIAKTGFNTGVTLPHVQRMIDEQAQLQDRRDKLDAFMLGDLFRSLGDEDQRLLHEQLRHMSAYLAVLNTRVNRATA